MKMSSGRARSVAMVVALAASLGGSGLVAVAPGATAASTATVSATGARSGATQWSFGISDEMKASVDVGTGNFRATSTDRLAPTISGMASFGLTYESLSASSGSQDDTGAAGKGWFMPMGQDTRLIKADDGSVLFVAPNGSQGKFTPSGSGYTAPAGFRQSLTKNSDGTWSMTDAPSQAKLAFNTDGRLTSITDRSGQVTTFTYSGGNVSSAALPTGQTVTFTFSGGKLASMTRPANGSLAAGTVNYSYNAKGQLASIQRPALPGGAASSTSFTYTDSGDLASITDALGNVTKVTYDDKHRATSVAQGKGSDMATTRFSYASDTQTLIADPTTSQSSAVSAVPHTTYTLDSTDRVTSATDALGRKRDTSYTSSFDISSQSNGMGGTASATYGTGGGPISSATSAMGSKQSWTYGTGSNAWNPASSTDAQGNSSSYTYDTSGRPTSNSASGGAKASVTYHDDGTLASSTDPAGRTTTYTESSSGKYIAKITPPSGSGMGPTTITGNPATSVTNGAGQTTTYTYNDRYGVTSIATSSQTVTFTYDDDGRVTSRTDKNQKVSYSYDARGNVTSIAASPVSGGKAPAASTVSYTYDAGGNMTSRTVNGSTTKYTYDAGHQLTSMTETSGAVTRFAYNNAGERVDTWWRTNGDNTSWAAHTHNAYGNGGNLVQTYTSVKSSDAAANRMSDYSYCYQKVAAASSCNWYGTTGNTGHITHIQNNIAKTDISLSYDSQNRLIKATNWAGHDYVYSYDKNGNRTATSVDGTTTQSLSFNADNQISSSGYAYDKAGRRTSDPNAGNATWDDLGRAVAQSKGSTSGTSTYAGANQDELIQQTKGSVTESFTYGRNSQAGIPTEEQVVESDADTTIINNDAFGKPIDFVEPTASQFLMYDGMGNMIGTIDTAGSNTSTYHLDPYGALLSVSSGANTLASQPKNGVATPASVDAAAKQLKASGTIASAAATSGGEAGWATFGIQGSISRYWKRGARWNDTYTGTWTSLDPITRLNDPNRANPYVYAGDNPINLTDPAGRYSWSDFTNDLSHAASDLSSCGAGFLTGSSAAGEVGAFGGPEAAVGAAAVGGVYGCGAGVFTNETIGTGWADSW